MAANRINGKSKGNKMSNINSFGPGSVFWGQMVQAILDTPELAGLLKYVTGSQPPHDFAEKRVAPQPSAGKIASVLLGQLSLKEAALKLPDGDGSAKSSLLAGIDAAIADEIDRCGTPWPGWPWPGPPPWVFEVVSLLGLAANSLQPGYLQKETSALATKVLARASALPEAR